MTNRLVIGNHPIGRGVWLSKPGIDAAASTNVDDYLLSSTRKNEQIFQAAVIPSLAQGGGNIFTPWVVPVLSPPLVMFQWGQVGFDTYVPIDPDGWGGSLPTAFSLLANVSTSGVQFVNNEPNWPIRVVWAAFVRSMP